MSADNWTTCPKCELGRQKKLDAYADKIKAAYSKVSSETYAGMLAEYDRMKQDVRTRTDQRLREDYECGMYATGEFAVNYRCSCRQCDFTFSYRHSEQVTVKEPK